MAYNTNGYIWGNYDYFDKARPLAQQGKIMNLQIQTSDPSRTADIEQILVRGVHGPGQIQVIVVG